MLVWIQYFVTILTLQDAPRPDYRNREGNRMGHEHPPAYCPSCGAIFQSKLTGISGVVTNLLLSGDKETCPFCGNWTDIGDGVFDIADNVISVVSAPNITLNMLKALETVAKQAYRENLTPDEAIEAANAISPDFRILLKSIPLINGFFKVGLLFILHAINRYKQNIDSISSLDVNKLISQVTGKSPTDIIQNRQQSHTVITDGYTTIYKGN